MDISPAIAPIAAPQIMAGWNLPNTQAVITVESKSLNVATAINSGYGCSFCSYCLFLFVCSYCLI